MTDKTVWARSPSPDSLTLYLCYDHYRMGKVEHEMHRHWVLPPPDDSCACIICRIAELEKGISIWRDNSGELEEGVKMLKAKVEKLKGHLAIVKPVCAKQHERIRELKSARRRASNARKRDKRERKMLNAEIAQLQRAADAAKEHLKAWVRGLKAAENLLDGKEPEEGIGITITDTAIVLAKRIAELKEA